MGHHIVGKQRDGRRVKWRLAVKGSEKLGNEGKTGGGPNG